MDSSNREAQGRRLATVLVPVAVGLLAFAVYFQTLLPSVGWGDIARFQYLAQVWGIPHRFGYPLYIGVSRLFGYLPVGDVAYRINLMSAVFAALAAVMVCLIVLRLAGDWVPAASASCALPVSLVAPGNEGHQKRYHHKRRKRAL